MVVSLNVDINVMDQKVDKITFVHKLSARENEMTNSIFRASRKNV